LNYCVKDKNVVDKELKNGSYYIWNSRLFLLNYAQCL